MKKSQFKVIEGSVVAPQGFLAAGVFCDIKRLGTGKGSNKPFKPDLALIVSETPATVAGTFTTNQVCAAPVKLCVERVKRGVARAVVVNSGNANACTGKRGLRDAAEMARIAARRAEHFRRRSAGRLDRAHRRAAADGQRPQGNRESRRPAGFLAGERGAARSRPS